MRSPVIEDGDLRVYLGDAAEVLAEMPAESVQCVVTSPPYWGLRDYGTGDWEGGDAACDHAAAKVKTRFDYDLAEKQGSNAGSDVARWAKRCPTCGALRVDRQLGMEATPEEYVERLVGIFRHVRRVLRDDGTAWLNLGDSYANDAKWGGSSGGKHVMDGQTGAEGYRLRRATGLKPKDLVGVPWRVAFALQADGWYLRSDIIWAKPNPMPESILDRPTKAHEYVFLLSKRARYFYDADAIREPHESTRWGGAYYVQPDAAKYTNGDREMAATAKGRDGREWNHYPEGGRNRRSVWEIPTQAFPEAHFATFPEKLVEPCIMAGTSEQGCCVKCGTPLRRVTGAWTWARGCTPDCEGRAYETVPCTVLDPFLGSGTTAAVARRLGRRAVGIDLSSSYVKIIEKRTQQLSLFA